MKASEKWKSGFNLSPESKSAIRILTAEMKKADLFFRK